MKTAQTTLSEYMDMNLSAIRDKHGELVRDQEGVPIEHYKVLEQELLEALVNENIDWDLLLANICLMRLVLETRGFVIKDKES